MKALIVLIGLTFLVSCSSNKEGVPRTAAPDQDLLETSSVNPSNPFSNSGSGPTGSVDPVNPPGTPPAVGPFPTPPAPPVLPTPVQFCGTLFKDFVDQKDYFLQTGDVTSSNIKGNFPASSVISQNLYPNDSKDVCLMGYQDPVTPTTNGLNNLIAESIEVLGTVNNPNRPNQALFNNEICGVLTQVTDFSGLSYVQIKENNIIAYILNNDLLLLPIPATTSNTDPAFVLRGCVYSNTASYNDFSITFKKFFDLEATYFNAPPVIIVN